MVHRKVKENLISEMIPSKSEIVLLYKGYWPASGRLHGTTRTSKICTQTSDVDAIKGIKINKEQQEGAGNGMTC